MHRMKGEQASDPILKRDEQTQAASHEVTQMLNALNLEDPSSTDALIPLVYDELRRLAAWRLSNEKPGQTLQPTALVHEAYLRLVQPNSQSWKNRRHFFGAAAEAMRRILIENARRKARLKRGGDRERTFVELEELPEEGKSVDILDLNEALEVLEQSDPDAAELVKLRYFVGLNREQIAELLGVSPRTVDNIWSFTKLWLFKRLKQ